MERERGGQEESDGGEGVRRYYKKKKIGEKYLFNKVENNWRVTVAFRNCEEHEKRLLEHYFYDLVFHMWRIDEFTRAVGVTLGTTTWNLAMETIVII